MPLPATLPLRSYIVSSLNFGVPVFFLLSSFLITELLLRERDASGKIHVRAFYVRRILRIWPLYFLILFGGFAICRALHFGHFSTIALLAYIFLFGNWYTASHGQMPIGIGMIWSLNVEEQFYLFWPTLLAVTGRKYLLPACAGLWSISQLFFVYAWLTQKNVAFCYFQSLGYLQFFAIGAALSVILHGKAPQIHALIRPLMILAGMCLFFIATFKFHVVTGHASVWTAPGYILISIGAVLIFFAFLGMRVGKGFRPLVYLGKVSYGLYMYHLSVVAFLWYFVGNVLRWPHHDTLGFLFGLPVTIGIAALSYRFFEKPFLKLKEKFEIVHSRAA
jgi:peptidoglycan/LPS O-acetylase OafA/YrhL